MKYQNALQRRIVSKFLWFLLLVQPLILYGAIISCLHRDLPIWDDYIVQLEIAQILNAGSFIEKVRILFSQLNEHRLVYTRAWFLVDYLTFKNLSYSALIFVGNLPLLGICLILLWWIKAIGHSYGAMLCIGWLLFQFQYFENSLWAMASLQNITIHFFYLALFTLLTIRSRAAWLLSLVVALAICFTSGNGFLALAVASLSLVAQKRRKELAIWILLTAILSCGYFYQYKSVGNHSLIEGASGSFSDKLLGVFAFVGQACAIHPKLSSPGFIVGSGIVLTCLSFVLSLTGLSRIWRSYTPGQSMDSANSFIVVLVQALLFIGISAIILSHTRIEATDYLAAVSSRYQLYPTMLLICNFCLCVTLLKNSGKWFWRSVLPLAALAWLLILQKNLPGIYQFRSDMLASFHNTSQLPRPNSGMIRTVFSPKEETLRELTKISSAIQRPAGQKELPLRVNTGAIICPKCPNSPLPDQTAYIVLYHPDQQLLYPIRRRANKGFFSFWLKGDLFEHGFASPISPFYYQASNHQRSYKVGILERKDSEMKFYLTGNDYYF